MRMYGLFLLKGLGGPADPLEGMRFLLLAQAFEDEEATAIVEKYATVAGEYIEAEIESDNEEESQ